MQRKGKLCIGILALFIITITAPALADTGGYVVRPVSHDEIGDYPGNDPQVSFWELPLPAQAALASGAIVALAVAIKLLPFFAVKAKDKTANKNRERIYQHIKENPGSTMYDVARGIQMNAGSVRYHIYMLTLSRRVRVFKNGKFSRYFLNNHLYDEREMEVISTLCVRKCREIVSFLLEHPGLPNHEIASKLGIHQSLAHANLSRLLENRVIRYEMNGQRREYYLESDVGGIFEKTFGRQTAKCRTV